MTTDNINIKLTADTGQAVQSTENYKKTLKDLKDQMVQLQIETNGLTEATAEQRQQYAELEKQAGMITDALGDVSARVRANADDFQNFNAALEGLKGGAAVAQGLVGTLDLLGVSNTGVEQVVKTLMSLQGVMNSINAVQHIFNKDSKVRIALQQMLTTSVKQTTVAEGGATLATGALAAGEKVATNTSFTLAGACKAVGIAIKSIPVIGWILGAVSALTTLIGLIYRANKASKDGADESEREKKQREEEVKLENTLKKLQEDRAKQLRKINDEARKQLEAYKGMADAVMDGKKGTVEYAEAVEELNTQLGLSKEFIDANSDKADSWFEASVKLTAAQEEYNTALETFTKTQKEQNEYYQSFYSLTEKSADEVQEFFDEMLASENLVESDLPSIRMLIDKVNDGTLTQKGYEAGIHSLLNDQIKAHNKIYDQQKDSLDTAKDNLDNAEKTVDAIKRQNDEYKKQQAAQWRKDRASAQKEYIAGVEDMAIADAEYDEDWNRWADERVKKADRLYNEDLKKYGEQRKKKLITQEQYDALSTARTQEHENEVEKIRLDAAKRINDEQKKIDDDRVKRQKQDDEKAAQEDAERAQKLVNRYTLEGKEAEVAKMKGKVEGLKIGSEEYWEAMIELSETQRDLELEQLEQDHEAKLLSEEEYQIRKKEIQDKYNTEYMQSQQKQAANEQAAKEQLVDTLRSIYEGLYGFISELEESELKEVEGNEKAQAQIKKKYAIITGTMKLAQIIIDTVQGAMQAYNVGMSAGFPAGLVLGPALAAATAAFGAVQFATASVQMANNIKGAKAARGAYVVGPSHSEGGVPYELEGGEAVLNKKAMAIPQYRSLASAMNVSTGGVAFPGTSGGGLLSATIDDRVVDSIVSRTVAAVTAIPVVVSEESITDAQRKVSVLEGQSRI